jgi:3-oxoacyl-[acyl-carrier protein] reductase
MRRVLVTGASGGIGAAISRQLAQRGCAVILHYQSDLAGAQAALNTLAGAGHRIVQADLGDPGAIERLWRESSDGAPVEALINNAGIFPDHPPLTTSYAHWTEAWRRTLAVNLEGPAHLSYCAARAMSERGQGRIVSVSSRAAFRGELTAPAYAASKAGLNAFSQSLAKAIAARGVYVYVVAPGWVSTERVAQAIANPAVLADQPLGRVATPEEVAQVVAFCALDAPASMTGAVLDVNGASYLRT